MGYNRAMAAPRYEHFHHKADIGVRGIGDTVEQAFAQAARGMFAVVCDLRRVRATAEVSVACSAPDLELLLVDWLSALLLEAGSRRMLFSRFSVLIHEQDGGFALSGAARGEPVDRERHRPRVEVKAATWAELAVGPLPDGRWVAQCVVDV
ncbi:MAG: archease [Thermodesulfobacteriota bacterium]